MYFSGCHVFSECMHSAMPIASGKSAPVMAVADDLAKSITAKKRKLEQVTGSSVTTGNRKFDEVWKAQQSRRLILQLCTSFSTYNFCVRLLSFVNNFWCHCVLGL